MENENKGEDECSLLALAGIEDIRRTVINGADIQRSRA